MPRVRRAGHRRDRRRGSETARLRFGFVDHVANAGTDQLGLRPSLSNGQPLEALSLLVGEIHGCLAHGLRRVPYMGLTSNVRRLVPDNVGALDRRLVTAIMTM